MTDWQPAPQSPTPPAEPDDQKIPLWLLGLLVVLLLVGGAVAGNEVLKLWPDKGPEAGKKNYPSKWDPRVRPYVKIVEKERDLKFFHPIEVEFLSDAAFKKEVTSEEEDLTKEDREEMEHATGLLRSVGLIDEDVDLFAEVNQLLGGAVIGLYSFEDERIRIRGGKLDPLTRKTLVHELTHALQDQHFNIGTRKEKFEKEDDDSTAESAFNALVEGDANRIEMAYVQGLSRKQRAAVFRAEARLSRSSDKQTAGVPEILKTMLSSPYALGDGLLTLAVALDGKGAVDRLFRNPPTTEEHLLDPWTFLRDDQEPLKVESPELAKGEDEFESGEFGALGWYLVLAERLPLLEALDAVDGWGGDAYVTFERDDVSCVRVDYRGDTERDLRQMHSALRSWVAAGPGGTASVRLEGRQLRFESCDPGKMAATGKDASRAALELPLTRTYIAPQALAVQGEELSRCFANRAVRVMNWEDPSRSHGARDPAVQAKFRQIIAQCGGLRIG